MVLLCGDLNLHPKDLGCRLLKEWTGLHDAYLETQDFRVSTCLVVCPPHPSDPATSFPLILVRATCSPRALKKAVPWYPRTAMSTGASWSRFALASASIMCFIRSDLSPQSALTPLPAFAGPWPCPAPAPSALTAGGQKPGTGSLPKGPQIRFSLVLTFLGSF